MAKWDYEAFRDIIRQTRKLMYSQVRIYSLVVFILALLQTILTQTFQLVDVNL